METTASAPVTPDQPNPNDVQAAIDQVATQAAMADPNIPIEIKLKTGQVYKGLPHEVIGNLARSQEEASEHFRRMKDEQNRLNSEINELKRQQAAPLVKDDEYTDEEYYKLFQESPRKAQQYLDNFDPMKQEMRQTFDAVKKRGELEKFQSSVNFFPADNEKISFANEFVASGLEPNAPNYELVYWRMQASNKLSPPAITGMDRMASPPPQVRGGAAGGPQGFDMAQFENLPKDQMEQVIQRLKSQGWK